MDFAEADAAKRLGIAERTKGGGLVALPQAPQRWHVEMIVVIVAEENRVDGRQILKAKPGIAVALRAGKGNGAGAARPDGIREEVEAGGLQEHGGVIDEGNAQVGTVHPGRRRGPGWRGIHAGHGPGVRFLIHR